MSELLDGLNPEQADAVQSTKGPLLILAGAGSGKTRVLTRRIAWLIREEHVRPWNILAVTFTNKAAGEMKERVRHLVAEAADELWVSTFHSTSVRILRREIEVLGWPRSFAIWDDDDQARALKQVLEELKIDPKMRPVQAFRSGIDRAKNALRTPDDLEKDRAVDPLTPKVFRAYEERLKKAGALDFNDLINKVVQLWAEHPDVRERWQRRFRYVLVDEYQDTNPAQYRWLRLLVPPEGNLAVVGDDDQSIYSFRGADIRNILDFEKDYPGAKVIKLERNYRSTANILRAASEVVKNNTERKDKTLRTDAEAGALVHYRELQDEEEEALWVVEAIRRELRARPPGDFAIIYRTNAQSRPFERLLTERGIPYVLVGGRRFYERAEVRDVLAYLRLLMNPGDDMSFRRIVNVPTRGIGEKAVESVAQAAAEQGISMIAAARQMAVLGGRQGAALAGFVRLYDVLRAALQSQRPGDLVLSIVKESGYLDQLKKEGTEEAQGRIENIEELARAAEVETPELAAAQELAPEDRMFAFLDRVALASQADELPGGEGGRVTLLTAHLAKGLEYPVVFVVGLNEGLFPSSRSEGDKAREEERRLAYVAFTRAREDLYLSSIRLRWMNPSAGQGWGGRQQMPALPSTFLYEVPVDLFDNPPTGARRSWMGPRPASLPRDPSRAAAFPGRPPPRDPALGRPTAPPRPPLPPPRPSAAKPPPDRRRMRPESVEAFRVGVEVFHPILGVGTIERCEGTHGSLRLTIHFREHGPKTVFAASAGMDVLLP